MYLNLQVVSSATDAKAHFSVLSNWQFAAKLNSISITFDEANELAREYVLMFSGDGAASPVCLLGNHTGNLYINPQGGWAAKAIPARLRAYPFTTIAGASSDQAVLLRDAAAPHFSENKGEALFDAAGQPSAFLRSAEQFLTQVHESLDKARLIGAQLRDAGILCPVKLEAPSFSGLPAISDGFLTIDVAKFDQLPHSVREALDASGATAMVVAQRRSLANAPRLFQRPAIVTIGGQAKSRAKVAEAAVGTKPARTTSKVAKAKEVGAPSEKKPRAARKPAAQ